jgi:hypothetical protein
MSLEPRRYAVARLLALVLAVNASCTEDERPPEWEYLSPAILQPNCATASCHSPGAAVAGLDFSTPARGYTSLMGLWVWIVDPNGTADANCRSIEGRVVCQRAFRPLVVPYNPGQSRLVHMLRARGARRMPPDRPLPEADIRLIERWILEGAKSSITIPGLGRADGGAPPSSMAPPRDGGVNVTVLDAGGTGS